MELENVEILSEKGNEVTRIEFKGAPMAKNGTVTIEKIPLNKIKLNKNSRLNIDPEELDGLMQSIKSTGLLQPIGVIKNGTGYEICYGNRRFLACSKLGMTHMPVIVHERKSESDVDIKNLTENVQRRNISLSEVGRYIEILEKEGLNNAEAAVRLGVSKGYVKSAVDAFQQVPKEFREDIEIRVVSNQKGSTRSAPGKISVAVASKIVNAQKSGRIDKEGAVKLYKAAKSNSKFSPVLIDQYISSVEQGHKDFIEAVPKLCLINLSFWITEKHKWELEKKYVNNGIYSSVQQMMYAILRGEKAQQIKMEAKGTGQKKNEE